MMHHSPPTGEVPPSSSRSSSTSSTSAAPHIALGKKGEDVAASYLKEKGYTICGRNVRTAGGEIDVIARKGEVIIFIEVKTNRRHSSGSFRPSVRVDCKRRKRLQHAAELWLETERARGADLCGRIDVIEVCSERVVEHFEDVGG